MFGKLIVLGMAIAGFLAPIHVTAQPAGPPPAASRQPFPPVDQGANDPAFAAFREELQRIVEARDLDALDGHFHRGITTSFGGNGGVAEATERFRDDPALWDELAEVLRLGGRFIETGGFVAPYTFFAEAGDDVYSTAVVIGENVNVRAGPGTNFPVVGTLSNEVVLLAQVEGGANAASEWDPIETPLAGYVFGQYLRHVLDYRAVFVFEDGRWQVQAFVAGD